MPDTSSAAFPTSGRIIRPTVVLEIDVCEAKWSMESTSEELHSEMRSVERASLRMGSALQTQGFEVTCLEIARRAAIDVHDETEGAPASWCSPFPTAMSRIWDSQSLGRSLGRERVCRW